MMRESWRTGAAAASETPAAAEGDNFTPKFTQTPFVNLQGGISEMRERETES